MRCFFLSPIGERRTDVRARSDLVMASIISPALEGLGFEKIERGDHLGGTDRISDQTIEAIFTSDLCIADLTGQNPNVMYEVAIAQACKRPLVLLLDEQDKPPFDLQDWRHVKYSLETGPPVADSVSQLTQRVQDVIHPDYKPTGLLSRRAIGVEAPSLPSDANPRAQHDRFWEEAIAGAAPSGTVIPVWIAAHSAWYTFRPRSGDGSKDWDAHLFGSNSKFGANLDDLQGDAWSHIASRLKSNNAIRCRIHLLLAHPYGAEAGCVVLNQRTTAEESQRDARDDFFRTLRSIHRLLEHHERLEFDVRVLNPRYRVMTNTLYAVGDEVLLIPYGYDLLADLSLPLRGSKENWLKQYFARVESHFRDETINGLGGSRMFGAKSVNLRDLPENQYKSLVHFQNVVQHEFRWLNEAATRAYYSVDGHTPGRYHEFWAS